MEFSQEDCGRAGGVMEKVAVSGTWAMKVVCVVVILANVGVGAESEQAVPLHRMGTMNILRNGACMIPSLY